MRKALACNNLHIYLSLCKYDVEVVNAVYELLIKRFQFILYE